MSAEQEGPGLPLWPGLVVAGVVLLVYTALASHGSFRFGPSNYPHHLLIADAWLHGQLSVRDELLRTSAVVSLHVALDDSTRGMIGARELGIMKRSAVLINTCRGPVVDEVALHAALTSGQIAGAGLDVMTEEPPKKDHPLFALPNVTLTPHTAGPTWENWTARFRNGFDNIQRVAAGQRPLWVIPELA